MFPLSRFCAVYMHQPLLHIQSTRFTRRRHSVMEITRRREAVNSGQGLTFALD